MSAPIRLALAAILTFTAEPLAAQAVVTSPSPTLPSDTLEANYAPPSRAGPMPELAPTLPSDTLRATQPVDSFPTDPPANADSLSADSGSADSLRCGATARKSGSSGAGSSATRGSWCRRLRGPCWSRCERGEDAVWHAALV